MLKVDKLSYQYNEDIKALQEINFDIELGEFVFLLGINGSGKTTLLYQLNGLLKPSSGEVYLKDKSLKNWQEKDIFRTVGLVFQDPNDQLFAPKVKQDVAFGPENLRLGKVEIERRVKDSLRKMEVIDLIDRSIHQLSYGQKKRVAIAGVLAMEPDVMILDEPTAGLDPQSSMKLMKLLFSLKKNNTTIVLATHEIDMVPLFADRVIVLHQGKIVEQGTPEHVFNCKEKLRSIGLRLPRVSHLVEIAIKYGLLKNDKLPLTIGEALKFLRNDSDMRGNNHEQEKR